MIRRASLRVADIKERIGYIRDLLKERSYESVTQDITIRAAFERHIEVISEASRHLPEAWRAAYPAVPWRQVADIGNRLRHTYDEIELRRLWEIYLNDLDPLEAAIDAMLAANPD